MGFPSSPFLHIFLLLFSLLLLLLRFSLLLFSSLILLPHSFSFSSLNFCRFGLFRLVNFVHLSSVTVIGSEALHSTQLQSWVYYMMHFLHCIFRSFHMIPMLLSELSSFHLPHCLLTISFLQY